MLVQALSREGPLSSLRSKPKAFSTPEPLTAVDRMVALICHDLRLPLTAILANAEFLTASGISNKERAEIYQEIRWSIDRMNDLISSLLESSKDRDAFRPAAGNIVDTVERAIRMTSAKQGFRRITIKHHHKGLAVGWFDSNRLERAVANLVLNACEAVSPDSGRILITTIGNPSCLQIGVWDNGLEYFRRIGQDQSAPSHAQITFAPGEVYKTSEAIDKRCCHEEDVSLIGISGNQEERAATVTSRQSGTNGRQSVSKNENLNARLVQ